MQCIRAKTNHLIRRQAIKHYLHDKRRDVFTFMSLWNDEEPYPLNELIIAQLFFVDELKADATLQRLQALQKQRGGDEYLLEFRDQYARAGIQIGKQRAKKSLSYEMYELPNLGNKKTVPDN